MKPLPKRSGHASMGKCPHLSRAFAKVRCLAAKREIPISHAPPTAGMGRFHSSFLRVAGRGAWLVWGTHILEESLISINLEKIGVLPVADATFFFDASLTLREVSCGFLTSYLVSTSPIAWGEYSLLR